MKWIRVKDKLPVRNKSEEGNGIYPKATCLRRLVCRNDCHVDLANWHTLDKEWIGNRGTIITKEVTHWMPLPEKPK